MKKLITITILVCLMGGLARAGPTTISFADSILNVDSPAPTGWSTGDGVVSINSSYGLLGGMGSVTGYIDGTYALSHRLTRGLGVAGGEQDEVDTQTVARAESIEITFNIDYYVNSLEVRSLFIESGGTEQGVVDFYLGGGSSFYTENLVAVQPTGGSGVLAISYGTPKLVDKLVFYVPSGQDYTSYSEFAVAKLNVTPIPAPGAILLGSIGVGIVGWLRKNRTF